MKAEMVAIERISHDPKNPRTDFSAERKAELVASIKVHGIKVPLIVYVVPGGLMVGDGHCRLDAAIEAGLLEVPVISFPQKPGEAELLATQLTINGHRHALNPVDEYEAFARLAKLRNWTASELAGGLAISNAAVTTAMAIGKLSPDERQLVRDGTISKSGAYALTRMSPERRAEMARKAASGGVTRDMLNRQARKPRNGEDRKARRVTCAMAGASVSVQSEGGLNLASLIELLEELVRECRKARSQKFDLATAMLVLRDRSRALSASKTTRPTTANVS